MVTGWTLALLSTLFVPYQTAFAQFSDSFSRPDSPDLGNGWIEKNAGAFELQGGSANKLSGGGYLDNIAYRPSSENLLDVEAAVEFRINDPVPGYPQIFVRVQTDTVAIPSYLDGYILYVNNSTGEAVLGQQVGAAFANTLTSVAISPGLNTTDTFRLRLRATGTDPVELDAFVERLDGASWTIIGQSSYEDWSPQRITSAGTVGFGGYIETSYTYDNFSNIDLSAGNNPLPALGSLNPDAATEGGSAFSLTVNGADFIPGSVVRWDGADRVTTYISESELQAAITAADIAVAGTATVTVFNPGPGGGTSTGQTFTIDPAVINNPAPTLDSLSPDTATEGGSAFSMTVNGADFIPGSVVRWNGGDRVTTFVSSAELQADITAADIAVAGNATVTVFNPGPGGGTSTGLSFTIDPSGISNPVPTLGTLNPSNVEEGGPSFTLTVNGADFVPGSVVRWNGADRTTTFVSDDELQADIDAADIAVAGTATVTVFSPGPGGGTSSGQTFTIDPIVVNNPVPIVTSLDPSIADEGGSAFSLTVNGSDFVAGAVVRWNGADRATTYVTANELQAAITAADIAVAGTATVTVFNPGPGGGTSGDQTFTIDPVAVNNPVPVLGSLNPDTVPEGSSAFSITINGSDFVPGSMVQWNGSDRATTYVSPTELQASIAAVDVAAAGTATVTVFNPGPGGGTSAGAQFNIVSTNADFLDTFSRADSPDLGNGWIEKNLQSFELSNGRAAKLSVGSGYLDNIAYRPSSEDMLDVEAAVEFRLLDPTPGYAQIFVRVQSGTVAIPSSLDGYILYLNNSTGEAVLGQQVGTAFANTLSTLAISPGLNTTDTFRMRLRATGTDPVELDAFIERLDGASWTVIGQTSYTDWSAQRIDTAGTVGFGGYIETSYDYDNFSYSDLGSSGNNPLPALGSMSPDSATEGASAFSLTVNGADFIPGSVVRWNGGDRTTTYVSSTELQANITAADVATAGTATVTVFNPGPGGGTSAGQTFTIDPLGVNNPVPTLGSINPNTATEGGSAFSLTVNGADFIPGSVVRWNGNDRTTTYVSSVELQANITAADIAAAGTATVTVFNPGPGGGVSGGQTFTIDPAGVSNPVPSLGSLSPNEATEGGSAFALTIDGADFIPGSVVRWNGNDRTTTFVSSTQLQANITAADIATAGTATVTVFNPGPGGGSSAGLTFTINNSGGPANPVPRISDMTPQGIATDGSPATVTVLGYDFTDQSTILWNNSPRATTFSSAQELSFDLTSADLNSSRVITITVSNPAPGGGISNPYPFIITEPTDSFFFDNFEAPDSEDIGNQWTEKSPNAFSLENGAVASIETPVTQVYRDNIVYRPASEDATDVHVSTEFVHDPNAPIYTRYPQVHARIQRDSVNIPDLLQSYILFVDDVLPDNGGYLVMAVGPAIAGMEECFMTMDLIPGTMVFGERYRLRFSVTGSDPVQLDGAIDRFDGTVWQELVSASTTHDENTTVTPGFWCPLGYMPDPIVTGGSTGFSKYWNQTNIYDNFYAINQDTSGGTPVIAQISPDSVEAGQPGVTLFVEGSNFDTGSVVRWNGSDRPTTYLSSTGLQAIIDSADISTVSTALISVYSPQNGGSVSNTVSFEIVAPGSTPNPVPQLDDLTPRSIVEGTTFAQITVQGSDFVLGSVVRLNGVDLPTVYNSSASLTADVGASELATAGSAAITVFSPALGGGTSQPVSLAIVEANEFFDDFNRADNSNPGNGWTEKAPAAFEIRDNQLAKTAVTTGYLDNFAYRPPGEDLQDVETSVEFELNSLLVGYPQIFNRLQQTTAGVPGTADAYMLYLNDSASQAVIGRQIGSNFVASLANVNLAQPLDTTSTYRMRLRTSGTNPVVVEGYIERLRPDGFEVIGSASVDDFAGSRITTPGASGIGGYIEATYVYDNFRARDLN